MRKIKIHFLIWFDEKNASHDAWMVWDNLRSMGNPNAHMAGHARLIILVVVLKASHVRGTRCHRLLPRYLRKIIHLQQFSWIFWWRISQRCVCLNSKGKCRGAKITLLLHQNDVTVLTERFDVFLPHFSGCYWFHDPFLARLCHRKWRHNPTNYAM